VRSLRGSSQHDLANNSHYKQEQCATCGIVINYICCHNIIPPLTSPKSTNRAQRTHRRTTMTCQQRNTANHINSQESPSRNTASPVFNEDPQEESPNLVVSSLHLITSSPRTVDLARSYQFNLAPQYQMDNDSKLFDV
jgi:hypothetical protein